MDRNRLMEALAAAIREETDNPGARIAPEMTASDVPGWDSLAHARIVMNVEARTGATIELSDTYKAATIGQLADIVAAALAD